MSIIHFECFKCGQPIDVPKELANQLIECPSCKETIEIPTRSRDAITAEAIIAQPTSSESNFPGPLIKIAKHEYTVVPFVAIIDEGKGSAAVAAQLQLLIDQYGKNGWEYVRLESVETYVKGDDGCFGIGTTPSRSTAFSMAVFKR